MYLFHLHFERIEALSEHYCILLLFLTSVIGSLLVPWGTEIISYTLHQPVNTIAEILNSGYFSWNHEIILVSWREAAGSETSGSQQKPRGSESPEKETGDVPQNTYQPYHVNMPLNFSLARSVWSFAKGIDLALVLS